MGKFREVSSEFIPYVAPQPATFLSGTAVSCGGTSVAVTVPSGATSAWLTSEAAAFWYAINDSSAGTVSHGYVPSGFNGLIPPLSNFTSLHVYGDSGAIAHVTFFQE